MTDEDTYSSLATESYDEGFKAGHEEGLEEGEEDGKETGFDKGMEVAIQLIEEIRQEYNTAIETIDPDIIQISVKINELLIAGKDKLNKTEFE